MLYGTPDRKSAFERIHDSWDIIVVGGGITGAGIMREAVRLGLKVLLLEQNDFASGTSSRSSKMVHGGLRYLNNFQINLTWQSVHEREKLLKEGAGLVDLLPFLVPTYIGDKIPAWMYDIGLYLYGWMGGKWRIHQDFDAQELRMMSPYLSPEDLTGGFRFFDAQTDDSRLVLRVIREGVQTGHAVAINYARVEGLLRDDSGQVIGATVCDRETDRVYEAYATAIVNATGAWADRLRAEVEGEPRIRPLRGSHLLFRHDTFPLYQAVSFSHPDDGRPVFAFPWEGVTLLGTTDLDHDQDLDEEPRITSEEFDYLLRAVNAHFPGLALTEKDVMATFAGVRPVISHGQEVDPSKESREHALWNEHGLLTVTGGKLTTFRCMALDVLKALKKQLPQLKTIDEHMSALDPLPEIPGDLPGQLTRDEAIRLVARYGAGILALAGTVDDEEWCGVKDLPIHWLEFRWAARHEAVNHLDDLLLRRVRVGLLLEAGGVECLPKIRELVQDELGWDDRRWEQEAAAYIDLWHAHYGSPKDVQALAAGV